MTVLAPKPQLPRLGKLATVATTISWERSQTSLAVRLEGLNAAGDDAAGRLWQDVIDLRGATPVLSFGQGHLAGEAAATRHSRGRGEALYLGTLPDRVTLRRLIGRACRHAGLELRPHPPGGVEAVSRGEYQFLISHTDRPVELDLGAKRLALLTGVMVGPRAVLAPRDALVLRDARALGANEAADQGPGPSRRDRS
jgi:beta-galactosidase